MEPLRDVLMLRVYISDFETEISKQLKHTDAQLKVSRRHIGLSEAVGAYSDIHQLVGESTQHRHLRSVKPQKEETGNVLLSHPSQ